MIPLSASATTPKFLAAKVTIHLKTMAAAETTVSTPIFYWTAAQMMMLFTTTAAKILQFSAAQVTIPLVTEARMLQSTEAKETIQLVTGAETTLLLPGLQFPVARVTIP